MLTSSLHLKWRHIVILISVGMLALLLISSSMVTAAQLQEAQRVRKPDLGLEHILVHPTRLAVGPRGSVFVSDVRVGSVFILDRKLELQQELKGLDSPLGVAVNPGGDRIYVGNMGRKNVEVYDRSGLLLRSLGNGNLGAGTPEFSMPNDIVVAPDGRVFVVDSTEHCVKVYNQEGARTLTIGSLGNAPGEFDFPSCLALSPDSAELYVGDQNNYRVQVFDLDGTFLREFGGPLDLGAFQGNFGSVQSLLTVVVDGEYTEVHVVDATQNWVQVLTEDGAYLRTYGETGTLPGQLNLPLDIAVDFEGKIIACNSGNRRVEAIH